MAKRLRRFGRFALAVGILAFLLFALASNSFVYLSHQRFPILAWLQLNHRRDTESSERKPIIVGHRGIPRASIDPDASAKIRTIGNTRDSIKEATESTILDWIEIDVRRTSDGKLVLFHDDELKYKTNTKGTIESRNWIDDLENVKLKVAGKDDQRILLLRSVLMEYQSSNLKWILDIKIGKESTQRAKDAEALRDQVIALLREQQIPSEQIIIFGDRAVLEAFQGSGYRQGYTALFKTHKSLILSHSEVLQRCEDDDCDLLVVPIVFVTPSLVRSANEKGITIWSYDSDDPRDLRYCHACGVQGLIVDKPDQLPAEWRL